MFNRPPKMLETEVKKTPVTFKNVEQLMIEGAKKWLKDTFTPTRAAPQPIQHFVGMVLRERFVKVVNDTVGLTDYGEIRGEFHTLLINTARACAQRMIEEWIRPEEEKLVLTDEQKDRIAHDYERVFNECIQQIVYNCARQKAEQLVRQYAETMVNVLKEPIIPVEKS